MICSKCGMDNPEGSTFCNNCGGKFEEIKTETQTDIEDEAELKRKEEAAKEDERIEKEEDKKLKAELKVKFGCSIIIILVLIVGFVSCSKACSSGSSSNVKSMVWVDAQEAVKNELKSPSTADFPWGYDDYVTDNGDGTYSVSAYVDAENSFGAKVRSNFSCTVKDEDGGGHGTVSDLVIDNNK